MLQKLSTRAAGYETVAKGRSHPVGRIRWSGRGFQPKMPLNHVSDLIFCGASPSHHGLFDLPGGVFGDGQVLEGRRKQDGPPGMPEGERTPNVFPLEDVLHRHRRWLETLNNLTDSHEDLANSVGEGITGGSPNYPTLQKR